jgi:DNA-binding transcriptional regulator LsrR (DeoR family)
MGAMVRKLVTWPQPEDKDGERGRSIEFVPILGDLLLERAAPLYSENHRCHATNLAAQLADFFGQTRSRILLHAPAYIPEGFQPKTEHAERVRTARAFIEAIPAYRLVFGERRDGLIDRVDTLVTSVGGPLVLDPEDQGWLRPTVTNADERASLQSAGVVGDLCGRFVTKTQVTNFPADSAITAANDRCFGPQIEHFRECATRARDTAASRNSEDPSPGLGVMVVAAGAEKAEVVFSVCFNKLVNELVVDSDLAAALLKLTKEYNAGTGTGGPRRR